MDFGAKKERIDTLRRAALEEVWSARGLAGVIELADSAEAASVVGVFLPAVIADQEALAGALGAIAQRDAFPEDPALQQLVAGAAGSIAAADEARVLGLVVESLPAPRKTAALVCFPFRSATWALVAQQPVEVRQGYWRDVHPRWDRQSPAEYACAVEHLIQAGRPRAAFRLVHMEFATALQPRQLVDLLRHVVHSFEPSGVYQIDRHSISEAFRVLRSSGEVSEDDMAGLE
ncbi:MAG: hypothetical protein EBZ50_15625, partial [Alphaproteobacteria bacterium]|nr:hypothetical protein [Alphaproteobacteria bacterium]